MTSKEAQEALLNEAKTEETQKLAEVEAIQAEILSAKARLKGVRKGLKAVRSKIALLNSWLTP